MEDDAKLSAAQSRPAKLLKQNDDGSAVWRIPVLTAGQEIDLGRTASSSAGSWVVGKDHLQQMLENFREYPGPVSVGVSPHKDAAAAAGPALGFYENLAVEGDTLWADVWCSEPLAAQMKRGEWRGYSGEFSRDLQRPTKSLTGWAVTGGIFTNRPATDVHFKVAAEAEEEKATAKCKVWAEIDSAVIQEERSHKMASLEEVTVQLATAEAQAKSSTDRATKLEERLRMERQERVDLEAKADRADKRAEEAQRTAQQAQLALDRRDSELADARKEVETLETERKSLRVKLQEMDERTTAERVSKIVRLAISQGVPPAIFEGWDKDTLAWFKKNHASVESLQALCETLPKTAKLAGVNSGKPDVTLEETAVSPEVALALRKRGLDPKYATVNTSDDLAALRK